MHLSDDIIQSIGRTELTLKCKPKQNVTLTFKVKCQDGCISNALESCYLANFWLRRVDFDIFTNTIDNVNMTFKVRLSVSV